MNRKLTAISCLAAALLLMLPVAAASHMALYYARPAGESLDASPGMTMEDDGAVAHAPGTPIDAMSNRVVHSGNPGEDQLFLDARIAHRVQPGSQGPYLLFAPEHYASDLADRPNVMLPGPHGVIAWYGTWADTNTNGMIDDIYDHACGEGSTCADDEFRFRGRVTNEEISILYFVYPSTNLKLTTLNNVGLFGLSNPTPTIESLQDYTDQANDQVWYDTGGKHASSWSVNGPYDSLLVTLTMVTVADPPRQSGLYAGHDIRSPSALVDVDVYESVSADVENLYLATGREMKPTIDDLRLTVNVLYDQGPRSINENLSMIMDVVNGGTDGLQASLMSEITPAWPKEPNHADDDYNANAFFGGVGDVLGTGNSYPGYQSDYNFFVDARGGLLFTYVNVRGKMFPQEALPSTGNHPHERQAGLIFSVVADLILWYDRNGDGYPGWVCDPSDPEEWDAATGTCREARIVPNAGSRPGMPETEGLCGISPKERIRLDPIGGPWPGAVVLRKQGDYPVMVAEFASNPEVYVDDSPIFLDWWPCTGSSTSGAASDVVVFPASNLNIGVKTTVTATSGQWTSSEGIDYPGGVTVTDVDIYYPVL